MVRTGGWNQSRRTPPAIRPRGLTLILGLEEKICKLFHLVMFISLISVDADDVAGNTTRLEQLVQQGYYCL